MAKIRGYELDGEVLYNYKDITIATNPKTVDEHDLIVGNFHTYMGRGILEELAMSEGEHFTRSMETLTAHGLTYILRENDLTIEDLRIAFAQARITELKNHLTGAVRNWADAQTRTPR